MSTHFVGVMVETESGCHRRSQLEVDDIERGTTESVQPPLLEDEPPNLPLKDI